MVGMLIVQDLAIVPMMIILPHDAEPCQLRTIDMPDDYSTTFSGDGLVTDFNCIIHQCTAFSNGLDGLEGDDGTLILHSSAGQNGDVS